MRMTVTIDADTEARLREEAARTGLSMSEVLNRSVRRALASPTRKSVVAPLFRAPFPARLTSFNRLTDESDDEGTLRELGA